MNAQRHARLLASAGTGKTYRLAGHFLRLLLHGAACERVLATTFTRKAAAEILERVLARLLDAASGDAAELEGLRELAPRGELSAEGALDALAKLARRLDRFQVRTLDSFFSHVARLFALELELPPGWRIAEEGEIEDLRAEALARVLARLAPESRVELMRGLQRESGKRSVHRAMLAVVQTWRDTALDSAGEAWEALPVPVAPTAEHVAALGARLAATEAPLTKSGSLDQRWVKALDEARERVANARWEDLLDKGIGKKVLEGESTFFQQAIDEPLRALFQEVLRAAADALLARDGARTRSIRALLDLFEEHYRELQGARGAYRFEDLPRMLVAREALDGRRFDPWFRLDARLDHLLLDEFQDTAPLQWRALEPLAEQILSETGGERSFFCVGDVKQSIYGWRAAEPRLLEDLGRRFPVLARGEPLNASWRSSSVVLDTLDRVFARLADLPLFQDERRPALVAAARRWQGRYEAHATRRPELGGDARLWEAQRRHDEEQKDEAIVRATVERVAHIAAEHPQASVGVLVRANDLVDRLLYALRQAGVHASGEGGNFLTDAESVEVFLSALQLADHPSDTAAAFHVSTSPLAGFFGLHDESGAAAASRALRARLVDEGYGELAARALAEVEQAVEARSWSAWDARRFAQLVELAQDWDACATLRPEDFARHVRRTKVEDPSAAPVRVMTVHRAKGLEFDAVVLPAKSALLPNHSDRVLRHRPDPYGPITAVSVRPRKELLALAPEHAALAQAADERAIEESLSLLYVALTRARCKLEVILPPGPESGGISSAIDQARLLREALGAGEPDADGMLWRHPDSSDDWRAGLASPTGGIWAEVGGEPTPRLAPTTEARAPRRISPSIAQTGAVSAAELLRPRSSRSVARGVLVHRWMQEVEWLEDFELGDEELLAIGACLEPDERRRREALALFRTALGREAVRALLTRPAHGTADVHRERAFSLMLPDPDGVPALCNGRIDRLVLQSSDGCVTAADVIDFKTDEIARGRLAPTAEAYRGQLGLYRAAVATWLELDEAAVTTRLAFLATGDVLALHG